MTGYVLHERKWYIINSIDRFFNHCGYACIANLLMFFLVGMVVEPLLYFTQSISMDRKEYVEMIMSGFAPYIIALSWLIGALIVWVEDLPPKIARE